MRCPVSRKSRWIRIDLHRRGRRFSFFLLLLLFLANYMYIFRLTMRDLFNGRESGNGIRTRCSWEPFRSALASSSFTASFRMRGKIKRETTSITKLVRNLPFLSRGGKSRWNRVLLERAWNMLSQVLEIARLIYPIETRGTFVSAGTKRSSRNSQKIINYRRLTARGIYREKTKVLSTAVFRDELIPDSWFP